MESRRALTKIRNKIGRGSQLHLRLNTVERRYQAKVDKFNNRKDDATYPTDRTIRRYAITGLLDLFVVAAGV